MNRLFISVSPHFHSKTTTRSIMLDVIIALMPTTIAGLIIYDTVKTLAVLATGVGFAVISEYLFNKIAKKPQTVGDLSAVVTGLLLALTVHSNMPLWQVAVGSVFAIVIAKGVFGGIGQNFANPAITGRLLMAVSFGSMANAAFPTVDTVSKATPLAVLENSRTVFENGTYILKNWKGVVTGETDLMSLFLGIRGGAIGESCTIALIIGCLYLLANKIITWHTPVAYIGTVFVLSWIITGDFNMALAYTLAGGLFIGAIFMATDYATTPYRPWGKAIFGIGAGIITVMIRFYGNLPEGVSFAILVMNLLTPYIDKWTAKKPFGGEVK